MSNRQRRKAEITRPISRRPRTQDPHWNSDFQDMLQDIGDSASFSWEHGPALQRAQIDQPARDLDQALRSSSSRLVSSPPSPPSPSSALFHPSPELDEREASELRLAMALSLAAAASTGASFLRTSQQVSICGKGISVASERKDATEGGKDNVILQACSKSEKLEDLLQPKLLEDRGCAKDGGGECTTLTSSRGYFRDSLKFKVRYTSGFYVTPCRRCRRDGAVPITPPFPFPKCSPFRLTKIAPDGWKVL
ncbi:hypothetical protein B0H11DRAFT_1905238 [Mycena galericulata]|nr:hypothetical protein B0H11DRAFT_1905238 [Mycena galericulata]